MKAKEQDFYDRNRQQLHKIVPLAMPLTIAIECSTLCVLRCKFCSISSETARKQLGHVMKLMSDETFSLAIEQLKEFPQPFKRAYFTGLGEALLHPRLPYMIKSIKENKIATETMIFTNAVKLTHEKSLALVEAGLDIMTISVNGLSASDYKNNCGRRIDFDKYVEQIAFLYEHKGNLRINIKTVDLCVNSEEDRNFFFDTFGNICDYINIEKIAPIHTGVDYTGSNIKDRNTLSKFDSLTKLKLACSQPFYKLFISVSGKANFCDAIYGFPFEDLDIRKQHLTDIWNGPVHREFLRNSLRGICSGTSAMCNECAGRHNLAFPADDLDPHTDEILTRLGN